MDANTSIAPKVIRLGMREVEGRIGHDRTTIYRWYMADPPKFPRPHFVAERRAWFLNEIEEWERQQMARPRERSIARRARGVAARRAADAQQLTGTDRNSDNP